MHLADSKAETVTGKAGRAVWHNAEKHTVENVGKTETHVLDIELKKKANSRSPVESTSDAGDRVRSPAETGSISASRIAKS